MLHVCACVCMEHILYSKIAKSRILRELDERPHSEAFKNRIGIRLVVGSHRENSTWRYVRERICNCNRYICGHISCMNRNRVYAILPPVLERAREITFVDASHNANTTSILPWKKKRVTRVARYSAQYFRDPRLTLPNITDTHQAVAVAVAAVEGRSSR